MIKLSLTQKIVGLVLFALIAGSRTSGSTSARKPPLPLSTDTVGINLRKWFAHQLIRCRHR